MRQRPFRTTRTRISRKTPDEGMGLARRVASHVERNLGPIKAVLEGSAVRGFRTDMLWVEQRPGRPFHTLVTCGMATRPMNVTDTQCSCSPLAELVLRLPRDWPIGPGASNSETACWPIEELFQLAYLPHLEQTHLGLGHTVTVAGSNGPGKTPLGPGTAFYGWVLRRPDWAPRPFRHLRPNFRQQVDFFSAVPVHMDELELAYKKGSDALFERLDLAGVSDLIVVDRPSALSAVH